MVDITRREGTFATGDNMLDAIEARSAPIPAPLTVRVREAAAMLGISRSRVYELMESGDIASLKLGRATLVPVESLHALIDRLKKEQWPR